MPQFDALLLTRHWRDQHNGIELTFWAASDQGPLKLVYPNQQAICFVPTDTPLETGHTFERKPLGLTTLDGKPVDGLYFRQQRELQRLNDYLSSSAVMLYESDLKPSDRFLMERFINLSFTVEGKPIRRNGYLELINPRIKPTQTLTKLRYLSLDIETMGINGEIISVAYCSPVVEEILMQGEASDWPSDLPIRWFKDERSLLKGLLDRVSVIDPDLILGWNVINFDLNYIEQRCKAHKLPFTFGRGGELATVLQPQQSGQQRISSIPGRVVLDGIDNLKAAFWSFESFALGHVAEQLLGRTKLIESGDQKVSEIERQFREERAALAAYNLEDCRLVETIFEYTDLINFILQKSMMTGLALGRMGGSVAAFDNLYLPKLHRAGAVAPDTGSTHHNQSSPGGYVLDSMPGLYDNVLVLDFKSLYPSIIRTFKIDPLGMHQSGIDPIPGFLGAEFSRKEGILPDIIAELMTLREVAKQEANTPLSQAIKIIMNSFYGVLGSKGCRFFDPRLASSITKRGHEIIQLSRNWLEKQGFTVIYGDTDSVFVLLGPNYDEPQSKKEGQRLATELNSWWDDHLQHSLGIDSALEIEFETHFIRFVMPTVRGSETGSKKRYAGYIRKTDGDFELVFKGLENVRSDWTQLAKVFQHELYRRIFFGEPYEDFIKDTVKALHQGELDDQLIYRKRLRRPVHEYTKNVPPHAQAAKKLGKQRRWINYRITSNGPEPVELQSSPIDYQHYLERQLQPVADGILYFLDDSFERITNDQLSLF